MQYTFSDKIATLQPSAIREILKFTADPQVIPFAAGNPAPEAFPTALVGEITSEIFAERPIAALQYSITEGYPQLRTMLKDMLKSRYHAGRDSDELIIVSGAQQGVELATKVLCNEGDTVICEKPSFIGSLNSFKSYNTHLVGIELQDDGIDLTALEDALKANKNVRFIYLIPNFQNPSGKTMSLEKRKAAYALAKRYGTMILEDNPYGDLRFEGEDIPSIKSFDEDGIVIYLGSFSKVLSPGLRVGYVCAPGPIVQKMVVAKQASDVHTGILSQMICAEFLTRVDYNAHIAHLQQIYRKKCALMLGGMDAGFGGKVDYTRPQGGLFLWCTLPKGSDMMGFCTEAVHRKVAVVPGSAFMTSDKDETTSFRMNFSTPTDEQIEKGVDILSKLIRERF
ncbi:PLP-dependent aminotransferase family protein [Acetanaerobacterium elongatum]|uniref:2-aminoadipate transaminase n=1 Tax=Acetanaerobacterium elongatum TaxID=258515 RepID=A0A1G9V9D2_9FIRM|nr:PLP-dependent aminotransferase family protein [Acetanaerobacterium elongatum]SDM68802.1 2-aminoadipate transaminase [Acetanaerobacterium elongatum]